jgi:c-di-GMP-binding flagellar brake protein YcgR
MIKKYKGHERREFVRFDYVTPLAYKVCKRKTLSRLLQGYTSDISQGGLCCNMKQNVAKNNVVWLSFDRGILDICREVDSNCLIYQNGVLGKVAWTKRHTNNTYDVGVRFLTREEKNLTNIYPKSYFLSQYKKNEK